MKDHLYRHPHLFAGVSALLLVLAIHFHIGSFTGSEGLSFSSLLTLGVVVFAALILGIILYWWSCWRTLQNPTDVDPGKLGNPPDLIEIFFQPRSLVSWLELNLGRLSGLYTNLERISHLLGFINYSVELNRQLKVALSLAQEIFPKVSFVIFLQEGGKLKFQIGSCHDAEGKLVTLEEKGPLVQRAHTAVQATIELNKLQEMNWKCFSLPLKTLKGFPELSIMPLMLWNRILGLIVYIRPEDIEMNNDEKVLASLLNRHMAIFIENHLLYREKIQQERLLREVEIARQVQTESLPQSVSPLRGFDIFGNCTPCNEISGDYYDLVPLSGDRLLVAIADVSGKGLPASLFLSKLQTLIRALAENYDSPAKLLNFLSRHMSRESMGSLFATMLLVMVRADSSQVLCSSAGHCKPLVVRSGAGFVEEVNFEVGIPLGLFDQGEDAYVDQVIDLIPGDGVFLYTDGVSELAGRNRERYGTERIQRVIEQLPPGTRSSALVYALLDDMNRFKGSLALEDDVTMVYFRLEKPAS